MYNEDDEAVGRFWFHIMVVIVVSALFLCSVVQCHAEEPDGYWTKLASKYNCEWVRTKLKIYSEDELIKKAKRWHIPERIIELGKSCPR
jgi:hypothetical protein